MKICFGGVILSITLTLQRYSYHVAFYRWESWGSRKLAQGPTEGKRKVENEATIRWPHSLSFSSPARLVPPLLPGSGPGDVSVLRMGVTMSSEMVLYTFLFVSYSSFYISIINCWSKKRLLDVGPFIRHSYILWHSAQSLGHSRNLIIMASFFIAALVPFSVLCIKVDSLFTSIVEDLNISY